MVCRSWGAVAVRAVRGCGFTKGHTFIHISFGIPISRGFIVASSAHVHTTLPALGGVLTSNNTLVVTSRVNHPGGGPSPGCSLDRVHTRIDRLLNISIGFTSSYGHTSSVYTTLGPNRTMLLRGLHFCTRRRNGPHNLTSSTSSRRGTTTGVTVGTTRHRFTGRLTSCTSYCIGSTFKATRHTRTSATVVTRFFSTSGGVFNFLVGHRIVTIRAIVTGAIHPFATVVNNSGMSSGVSVVRGLLAGISGLVVTNNVACAFVGTLKNGVNHSVYRSSGLSLTLRLLSGTGGGNIGLILTSSTGITSSFSGSTGARFIRMHRVPRN